MIAAPGATSISVDVQWLDDTGAAVTGKVAADFPACKWSGGSNTADTTITLSDLAAITTAHPNDNTAGGVKEREGGWYRFDLPNTVCAAAGRKTITFAEAANKRIIAPPIDVQYVQSDGRQMLGTTMTEGGAGRLAGSLSAFGNVAAPVFTAASVNQSGDGFGVVNDSTFGNAKLVRSTTPNNTLDVSATGEAGLDWANVGGKTTANALTATTIAVTQKVDVDTIKTNPVVNGGTITFPTGATLASTTNITAGTIATVTNLTNLPSIPANWLTAAGIAASALNGKGDWGTATSLSGLITTVGVAGAGLTALGDTRLANLDATVSSRSTFNGDISALLTSSTFSNALPNNFAALVIDSGGTISRVTTVDSLTGTVTLATSQPNYAPAKAGDAMALTSGERTTLTAAVWAALTSGLTTAGSIGKRLVDFVTTLVYAAPPAAAPTAAANAAAVLDVAASAHNTAGTIGAKINAGGAAGDPFATDISTGYTAPQAGAVLYAIRNNVGFGSGAYAVNESGGTGAGSVAATLDLAGGTTFAAWATDGLRYTSDGTTGVQGLIVRVYGKATFDAAPGTGQVAETRTGITGRWASPVYLASGDYYVVCDTTGDGFEPSKTTIRIP